MTGTIDAIDEGLARIELDAGGVCTLPARHLPSGAREGQRIRLELAIDPAGTEEEKRRVAALQRRLTAGDDGGDLEL